VPTAQNGSGTSATRVERFDAYGQLIWVKDERGYIFRRKFDTVTGALTQKIDDVDTTQVTDEPAGWTTPTGGGLHQVTDYESDELGRQTQVLGPAHDVDGVTARQADWTVYKDVEGETWTARGYATGTAPSYTYTLVNPVSISKHDDAGRTTDQIVATRASTSGKLSSGDSFPQSTWVRWTNSSYNDNGQLTGRRLYHTIPASGSGSSGTNYDETTFGYDSMGRQNKQRSPGGTITRTVFDVRSQPAKVYVGTNDTGATDSDPTGGGASGNNMVLATENEYDGGSAGGDGNRTKVTQYVDAGTTRVTANGFDWRNRNTSIDGEVDYYQENTFDNLDRVTRADRKNTTSSGNLIARREVKFDDRGRTYQTIRYAVDPSTGTVGNSLTSNTWFDAAKHVIKRKRAGSELFIKYVCDGVGRETKRYLGYDAAETSYADAGNVTGDTLFEQVETTYDAASNVLYTTRRRRFHDATGTGELTSPTGSQPKARVSYVAHWYDGAGRQKATADYGTNGGASFSRPSTVPTRSDTVLVTTVEFNNDGEPYKSIDPKGTETRREFDDAGRRTKLIENYVDGDPSTGTADQDRTTQWAYTADGLVKTLTAKNPTTGDQVTKYVHGTTLTDSDVARSDLLRAVIYPDSDDADSPLGDGTDGVYDRVEHKYNRQGEVKETKDQNGTVHAFDFDKLGRRTQDRVTTLETNVDGAVRRTETTYEVRGLVEKVTCYDNATVGSGSVVNEVQHSYNNFGQLVTEYQEHGGAVNTSTSPKVQYAYANGSANHIRRTSVTYPNGRVLNLNYGSSGSDADRLSRVAALVDNDGTTQLAAYSYLGLGDFVKVDYTEPDIRLDLAFGAGSDPYDGMDQFDRVVDLLWRNYGTSADAERVKHGYDRAGNRTYRENTVAKAQTPPVYQDELYGYDGLYQVKDLDRGQLNAAKDGIVSGTLAFAQEWAFDATGNWSNFKEDNNGDGTWDLDQPRTHNKVNELTVIGATTGPNWADPAYDKAGNMTTIPQPNAPTSTYTGTWDAWNRLVKLMDGTTTVGEYAYDGLNRRVKKIVSGTTRHFYYSSRWQVLEERLGSATAADRQFVWGLRYIDDLVLRDRDADSNAATGNLGISSSGLEERLYSLQDPNWNVTAIANASGAIQERYRYDAYGVTVVITATFGSRTATLYDWETRYAGYRWDLDTQMYIVRYRILHPSLGRWPSRDPLSSPSERSDLYLYVSNRSICLVDPLGLQQADVNAILDELPEECQELFDRESVEDEIENQDEDERTCTVIVFAGHHLPGAEVDELNALVDELAVVWESEEDPEIARLPCGWALGGVGCLPDELNTQINTRFPGQSVPGVERAASGKLQNGFLPVEHAGSTLARAFSAATKHAKQICESRRDCCARVRILVCCTRDYRDAIARPANRSHENQATLCDNSQRTEPFKNVIDCD
jgi:RHS repeat-associated protein